MLHPFHFFAASMRFNQWIVIVISCVALLQAPEALARKKGHRLHRTGAVAGSTGTADARYADIILDPQTGEVYHSSNPDGRRYPASLTKMMTLYLLFEALDNKRVSLNTRLDVSEYATTMPQTNLALSAGDQIPVDTAIKALVVRSANDVAVVVAEALGGDVDHFADMMTAKARALGMKNTVFQNPNGLPNSGQYTTARDMAKLGMALRRDFPRYFTYFSVREFSWAGVSYYTHNRVMLRYAGVDGIKTGFIGASGFNLVTSCKRGGRPVIGVVMGGSSGRWRDDRMIQLLNQTYATIASRGAARGKGADAGDSANLPANAADDAATGATDAKTTPPPVNAGDDDADAAAQATAAGAPPVAPPPAVAKPDAAPPFARAKPPATPTASPTPATAKPVAAPVVTPVNTPLPAASSAPATQDWSIQVGAFATQAQAESAAQAAYRLARQDLTGAHVRVTPTPASKDGVFRALLVHISEHQATKACGTLVANHMPCLSMPTPAK